VAGAGHERLTAGQGRGVLVHAVELAPGAAGNPRARAVFEPLDGANRYAILYRVTTARRPETRANRIATFVAMCAARQTLHPARTKAAKAKSRARPGTRARPA
jgi:hypothetical protein